MVVKNERIGTFCEKCRNVICICQKKETPCCSKPNIKKWTTYSELKRCENCMVLYKPEIKKINENIKKS